MTPLQSWIARIYATMNEKELTLGWLERALRLVQSRTSSKILQSGTRSEVSSDFRIYSAGWQFRDERVSNQIFLHFVVERLNQPLNV
jgi:hypothetical protein